MTSVKATEVLSFHRMEQMNHLPTRRSLSKSKRSCRVLTQRHELFNLTLSGLKALGSAVSTIGNNASKGL